MSLPTSGTCAGCPAFFTQDGARGECRCDVPRRASPDDLPNSNRVFPVVLASDWCLFGRVAMATDSWPNS